MSRFWRTLIPFVLLVGECWTASAIPVLGSMYSDWGEGAGGIYLWKYPLKINVSKKKRISLYPVAVYTDKVNAWKYKVLRVRNKKRNKVIYAHVVDECSSTTSSCRTNKKEARGSGKMLLDIHQRAWKALGIENSYGLHLLDAEKVGTLGRRKLGHVLTSDGKKGYVPSRWQ